MMNGLKDSQCFWVKGLEVVVFLSCCPENKFRGLGSHRLHVKGLKQSDYKKGNRNPLVIVKNKIKKLTRIGTFEKVDFWNYSKTLHSVCKVRDANNFTQHKQWLILGDNNNVQIKVCKLEQIIHSTLYYVTFGDKEIQK